MGNSSSATVPETAPAPAEEDEVGDGEKFGVVIGPDLQATIVHDFQNRVLREEWDARRRRILVDSDERRSREEGRAAELEAARAERSRRDEETHRELDERTTALRNDIADQLVALRYDLGALRETVVERTTGTPACSDARFAVTRCLETKTRAKSGAFACDDVVETLEKCVHDVVVAAKTTSSK